MNTNLKLLFFTLCLVFNYCRKYDENILMITKPEVALYGFWQSNCIWLNNNKVSSEKYIKLKFPMEKNYGEFYGYFMIEDDKKNSIYISNRFKNYLKFEIPYIIYKKINYGTDTTNLFQSSLIAKNLYYYIIDDFRPRIIFLNSNKLKLKFKDKFNNEYVMEFHKSKCLW